MNRKEQLEYMVNLIDNSTKGSTDLEKAITFAKENGIVANMHLGNLKQWFEEDKDNRVAEWIMGQFIDGYENNQYLGFNSGINIARSFLAGTY